MAASTDNYQLLRIDRDHVEPLLRAQDQALKQHQQALAALELVIYALRYDLEHTSLTLDEVCNQDPGSRIRPLARQSYDAARHLREQCVSVFGRGFNYPGAWRPAPSARIYLRSEEAYPLDCSWNLDAPPRAILLEPAQMEELGRRCYNFSEDVTYSTISLLTVADLLRLPQFLRKRATYCDALWDRIVSAKDRFSASSKSFKDAFWLPEALAIPWPV